MYSVAVLGAGPAALIAAHAAASDGRVDSVTIYSRGVKSTMYGAQYLHAPIQGATYDDPINVRYRLFGSFDAYREKVYGNKAVTSVSPEDFPNDHKAWDIRATYDWLWLAYAPHIVVTEITPKEVFVISQKHDRVISAIPLPALCTVRDAHTFSSADIWAAGDAPDLGIRVPYSCPANLVVCDGSTMNPWYRKSNLYGHTTVEWPGRLITPPLSTASKVSKPISNDCDCWAGEVLRVGRYGTWRKGALSHEAFAATQAFIAHDFT